MNTFDSLFNNVMSKGLEESVIDIPRNSLSPNVWEFPDDSHPILKPLIKTQIINDIENINEIVPVKKFFIIGSILSKKYSSQSDIDVNVQVKEMTDYERESVFNFIRRVNGRLAAGTTHPINYFIMEEEYDLEKTSGAYDVANESWLKEPEEIDLDVLNYADKFQNAIENMDLNIAELRRDFIDIDELLSLDKNQIKQLGSLIKNKLEEIETTVDQLISSYQYSRQARIEAFNRDMTPDEIIKYGKKYKLPENVIYKMLEKYQYSTFIHKIKNLLDDDEIDLDDISKIKKAGNKHLGFKESVIQEKNKPKKRKPQIWKDPLNKHSMKVRGINRKTSHQQISSSERKLRGVDKKTQQQFNKNKDQMQKFSGEHAGLKMAQQIIDYAKQADFGIWRIPNTAVKEIANFYNINIPTARQKAKILGKTKIILWRKSKNHYYLVKDKIHYREKQTNKV